MALPKRVMTGGAYYKGYQLVVTAVVGDHALDMTLASKACAANGISVTPDAAGAGDYFKIEHLNAANVVQALLAETIYNAGRNVTIHFDFPAAELMDAGDKMRLTYTSVAGGALNLNVILERLTVKSGGA
jgi:hypothetical protein